MKLPLVSVIIPALNVEKTIDKCLNAIKNLNFPKNRLEIIIVDNGSKDRTLEIAKEFKAKIFLKPNINIGQLRNFGTKQARGSILAFIDSDVIVPREWLKIGLPYLKNKEIAMVGSSYSVPKDASWIAKMWELLRARKETGRRIELDWLPAGNMLIRKSTFNKLKGFSSIKTSEDVEFGLRVRERGYSIIADKRLKALHLGCAKDTYHFFKKRIWYASSQVELFRHHESKRLRLLLFALYHSLFITVLGISFIFTVLTKNIKPLIIALALFVLPSLVLALKNGSKMKRYKCIPSFVLVYLLWGLASGISVLLYRQWRHLAK